MEVQLTILVIRVNDKCRPIPNPFLISFMASNIVIELYRRHSAMIIEYKGKKPQI